MLAYAYIPAQEIINKKIEIKVLEGKLGEIKISGKENLRFSQINQALEEMIKLEEIEAKYDVENCNFLALKPINLDRYFKNVIFL